MRKGGDTACSWQWWPHCSRRFRPRGDVCLVSLFFFFPFDLCMCELTTDRLDHGKSRAQNGGARFWPIGSHNAEIVGNFIQRQEKVTPNAWSCPFLPQGKETFWKKIRNPKRFRKDWRREKSTKCSRVQIWSPINYKKTFFIISACIGVQLRMFTEGEKLYIKLWWWMKKWWKSQ